MCWKPEPSNDKTEKMEGEDFMATEEVVHQGNLAAGDELRAESRQEACERITFGLALALATEPSKLGQLRQMLMQLQEQRGLAPEFCTWAFEQLDEQLLSMALAYAHDAEVLLQILSFKGGSIASLLQDIESLYLHEKITQRVYVTAKLLLRLTDPPEPE
jgi:hypothetical protein